MKKTEIKDKKKLSTWYIRKNGFDQIIRFLADTICIFKISDVITQLALKLLITQRVTPVNVTVMFLTRQLLFMFKVKTKFDY